ncbi:hypothetical protein [Mycolicibacterium poriferae]|uniref:hypothetical protein n=2 Tax=Mycolicibacterium poriferae TaxID=39694 RepID=UPI0013CFEB38|nr:hypothetical protein [Mycolicibacterium poriferae]
MDHRLTVGAFVADQLVVVRFVTDQFIVDRFIVDRLVFGQFVVDPLIVDRFIVDQLMVDRLVVAALGFAGLVAVTARGGFDDPAVALQADVRAARLNRPGSTGGSIYWIATSGWSLRWAS